MPFSPIEPAIKEKIIAAHLAGKGRNQIDREFREQGVKVNHGSISNIIKKHKKKHEQSLQPNATITEQSLPPQQPSSLPPQSKAVSNGIDMNYTGSPVSASGRPGVGLGNVVIPRNGGTSLPLIE